MLAGRIKLKYFVGLVSLVGVAGIVLAVKGCKQDKPVPKPEDVVAKPTPPTPTPTPDPPPTPTPTPDSSDNLPARAWDAEVIAWKDKTVPAGKGKDVSKGKPYKINVYQDAGQAKANRAKVDRNRNDKWDEKYTFEEGKITLQIAPNDDEQYTQTYHWSGSSWQSASASTKPAPPAGATATPPTPSGGTPSAPAGGSPRFDLAPRAHDPDVLRYRDTALSGDKGKDVTKGKAYKVNVYQDAGHDKVNRAKVDLNRNDKWDEKYTFDGDRITLQRAPADDEKYTETYHYVGTGWAKE